MTTLANKTQQQLAILAGGYSIAGTKSVNQDAFALKINKGLSLNLKGHVAVIADGVSSANFAAQASQMSACHFIEEYLATPQSWSVSKSSATVIRALNSWLYSRTAIKTANNIEQQWYSTFSALILKNQKAHIFHIGDSQIAKIDADGYQVLTLSHANPNGVLNRAIGASNHVKVDYLEVDINLHDIFILTTDGVHQHITKEAIVKIIRTAKNLEAASQAIVATALKNGSTDNITCLIIHIDNLAKQSLEQIAPNRQQQIIPPALPINALLDHYKVLKIIQQTARSHIYLAIDTLNQQNIIIKVPSLNFSDDSQYMSDFIKEGWIGEQLEHQGLMKTYPQHHNSQFLYHVSEHIQGETLAQWIQNNPKPRLSEVTAILSQMISALRALQRMDIIHCDLKPDNFIVNELGVIKLIDYGSCIIGSLDEGRNYSHLGTLSYSAPEVLQGKHPSHKSDLYSLASIVYQMLCQKMPYKTITTLSDVPKSTALWRYRSVANYRQDLTSDIDAALSQALKVNPDDRTESFSEFLNALCHTKQHSNINSQPTPFIQSNPLLFYKSVSAVLFVLLILALSL